MQYICSGSAKALQRHCNCFAAALQKVCSNFAAVVCTILQHSFRAWQFKVINIPLHRHLQRTCQRLEDALYLMMFVLSFGFYIKIHPGSIAQGLEEMQEHFRRHISYLLALELGIPYQSRASAKVEAHLAETIVHRKGIAIAFNAPLAS